MKLSIITLNFRKSELTKNCMKSVWNAYKQKFESGEFELLIVDNLSGDNSVASLTKEIKDKKYKNYKLLPNDENSGFGAGNNFGAKKAKGEYILFLNNDTQVKGDGLWKMVEYLDEHQDVGILGGQMRNFDGSLQASAGAFYTLWNALLLMMRGQKYGLVDRAPRKTSEVDWVKGALLMIRRNVFEKIGGFDEKIFMYTEDMELCYRAHKMGVKIYFFPDVWVFHADQGSSNRTFAVVNIYKNLLYFFRKHRPFWEYWIIKFVMITKAVILVVFGKMTNNSYLSQTYGQALAVIN